MTDSLLLMVKTALKQLNLTCLTAGLARRYGCMMIALITRRKINNMGMPESRIVGIP